LCGISTVGPKFSKNSLGNPRRLPPKEWLPGFLVGSAARPGFRVYQFGRTGAPNPWKDGFPDGTLGVGPSLASIKMPIHIGTSRLSAARKLGFRCSDRSTGVLCQQVFSLQPGVGTAIIRRYTNRLPATSFDGLATNGRVIAGLNARTPSKSAI